MAGAEVATSALSLASSISSVIFAVPNTVQVGLRDPRAFDDLGVFDSLGHECSHGIVQRSTHLLELGTDSRALFDQFIALALVSILAFSELLELFSLGPNVELSDELVFRPDECCTKQFGQSGAAKSL